MAVERRPPWDWGRTPMVLPESRERDSDDPPCIVHLVRAVNGLDSLRDFVTAMRAHPPGIEHELVLAMKGFGSASEAAPYIAIAAELGPAVEFFPDRGLDLGLYFAAAARLRRTRYCFVNSHTRPVVDGWLAKLDAAFALPDVGMVGATGSWASFHSWVMYSLGLPSFYRTVLPLIREARALLLEVDFEQLGVEQRSKLDTLRTRLGLLSQLPEELLAFPPFPAPHLRNTTFMVSHSVLRSMRLFIVRNKMDTYVLESGSLSITRQVQEMGLRTLVVDRAGDVYEPSEWYRSGTLWQGEQRRLLTVDNRTRAYERGTIERRRVLSHLAWGLHADPYPPREGPPKRLTSTLRSREDSSEQRIA
ncbi:MAG: hypothetical protein JWN10_1101 [Solirubrobacterales bacterium]|nr:hypothetical protein [Solirubrobacterales bacterium]